MLELRQGLGCAHPPARSSGHRPWLWPSAILSILALVLAGSVAPWPTLEATPLAETVAVEVGAKPAVAPPNISQQELLAGLVRYGTRPEGMSPADFPGVDVLLATPVYFSFTGRQLPDTSLDRPYLVFYVSESVHVDNLPEAPPTPLLRVGKILHQPAEVKMLTDSPHHRTTQVRYSAAWSDGNPILTEETRSLEMVFPAASGVEVHGSTLSWELPISYGPTYSSREVALDGGVQTLSASGAESHSDHVAGSHEHRISPAGIPPLEGSSLSLLAIPALLGVILAALTPCLIDLSVYYGAYIGTTGAAAASGRRPARSSLIKSSLFFILGLTAVYTTGGALAGQAGQLLQRLGLVVEWSRPLTIVAGVVVILVALRMAAQLRAPLLCRLPVLAPSRSSVSGPWRSTLMGSTFAAQCFSCFSGTIISALILYAGSSGSPLTGALLMLVFSLGLGAMLLLAVYLTTRFAPLTFGLKSVRPYLGLASALVMLGIGATMILDKEHLVSDLVLRAFGVG